MREANYTSLDVFRSALRSHPLIADYVCDLLVARNVVAVRDDGSVIGVAAGAITGRAAAAPKGTWKDNWPNRSELIESIRGFDEDETAAFGDIQQTLKEIEEPFAHWIILHALWNLMAEGVVEKRGKKYAVTPKGEALHPKTHVVITQALKQVGPPYGVEAVLAALRAIPGHNYFNKFQAKETTTQERVNAWVEFRKKDGTL